MKFQLQYSSEKTNVRVGNESVEVKAFQIVVWMSISNPATTNLGVTTPKFPAILDTGTTHNFFLTSDQLQRWAGIPVGSLKQLGSIRLQAAKSPLFDATLWFSAGEEETYKMTSRDGIAVFDGDLAAPAHPWSACLDEQQAPNVHLRRHKTCAHSHAAAVVLAVLRRRSCPTPYRSRPRCRRREGEAVPADARRLPDEGRRRAASSTSARRRTCATGRRTTSPRPRPRTRAPPTWSS